MTCAEFTRALSIGGLPVAAVSEHVQVCAACRALWQVDQMLCGSRSRDGRLPTAGLPAVLARALAEHRGPTRLLPAWSRLALPGCVAALCVALTFMLRPRPDLQVGVRGSFLVGFCVLLASVLMGLLLHQRRGRAGLGIAPGTRWAAVAGGLLLLQLWAVAYARAPLRWPSQANGFAPATDCLLLGCAAAALVGAMLFATSLGRSLRAPRAAGALAGCTAGLAAALVLHVHCPGLNAAHLQIAHGLPLALAVLVGALSGKRWLSV